jgi:hypothetical protein
VPKVSKFTHSQFIEHYDDARLRTRYQKAYESLLVEPLKRSDSDVQTFVKAEKVNFSAKMDPAPRIISPRDPRYNYAVGLFIKPIEGALYKVINDMCGGTTVMKGMNSRQVGTAIHEAWSSFSNPVAVPFDAKRFDQHTRLEALKFEQQVYKLYYHGGELAEFAEMLSWQLDTQCRAYLEEATVKFRMGIRASGDMNTGLGTVLIAASLTHSYCVSRGLRYRLVNNGDDCVLIIEREDLGKLDSLHEFCADAGYYMVVESPVDRIEKIDFCQSSPVCTINGWTMVRSYPKSVAKDLVTLLPLDSADKWSKWANDIGCCGVALNSGVPVLQAFYSALKRSGDGTFGAHPWLSGTGMIRNARGLESVVAEITDEARVSFYEAFGVTPDLQRAIEDRYAKYTFNFQTGREGYNTDNIHTKPLHTLSRVHFET